MSIKFWRRVALAAPLALSLAGCLGSVGGGDGVAPHLKQLPAAAQELLATKGMAEDAPIFVRIFKEESELEIWKLKGGRFEQFKTYPICAWSGELGPKVVVGDKQAPEGFYTVTPGLMNPKSQFHLAFNLGYPNPYDRANARTGSALMVHGDCRSAGCFAMTDALIEEIYILAREAFKAGQTKFHVHAFPFRMTEANMKRHRSSKWYGFWKTLKAGYDAFEADRKPPIVKVCSRQYLVNVDFLGHTAEPDPQDACPTYTKIDPDKLPGIDGVPQTLLASLAKREGGPRSTPAAEPEPQIALAAAQPADAQPDEPARAVNVAEAAPAPDTVHNPGASVSASPVLRAPVRSTAVMASFTPHQERPKPQAMPEVDTAFVPAPATLPTPPAASVTAPANEHAAAPQPAPEAEKPAVARYVDPNAVQKPNRSGKGGMLIAGPQGAPSPSDPNAPSLAIGFAPQGGDSAGGIQ